jgi:uncharacterized protein YbjT (DUF2867 family)
VEDRLRGAGREVRVFSRSGGEGRVRGDLATGEGQETAVQGVEAILHCASSSASTRQLDVEGTERLLGAGVSHVLFISIVGVDRNPYFPYYRMKLETERIVERSEVPWTILKATQFHGLVLRLIQRLDRLPVVMPVPRGFLLQPIDAGEVADRTAKLAAPAGRVPDVGGPEVRTFADLARSYFQAAGRRKRVVEEPVPGKIARPSATGRRRRRTTGTARSGGKSSWTERSIKKGTMKGEAFVDNKRDCHPALRGLRCPPTSSAAWRFLFLLQVHI